MYVINETRRNLLETAVHRVLLDVEKDQGNIKEAVGSAMVRHMGCLGLDEKFVFHSMSGGRLGHLPDVLRFIRFNGWILDSRAAFSMHRLRQGGHAHWMRVHETCVNVARVLDLPMDESFRDIPGFGDGIAYHPVEVHVESSSHAVMAVPGRGLSESLAKVDANDMRGAFPIYPGELNVTGEPGAMPAETALETLRGLDRICADEGLSMVPVRDIPGLVSRYSGDAAMVWGIYGDDGDPALMACVLPIEDIAPVVSDDGIDIAVDTECAVAVVIDDRGKNDLVVLEHRLQAATAANFVFRLGDRFGLDEYVAEANRLRCLGLCGGVTAVRFTESAPSPLIEQVRETVRVDVWEGSDDIVVETMEEAMETVLTEYLENVGRLLRLIRISYELEDGRVVTQFAPEGTHFLALVDDRSMDDPGESFGYPGDGMSFAPRWPLSPVTNKGGGLDSLSIPNLTCMKKGGKPFLARPVIRWKEE